MKSRWDFKELKLPLKKVLLKDLMKRRLFIEAVLPGMTLLNDYFLIRCKNYEEDREELFTSCLLYTWWE